MTINMKDFYINFIYSLLLFENNKFNNLENQTINFNENL